MPDQVVSNNLLEPQGRCVNLGVSSDSCCSDSKRFNFCVILELYEVRSFLQLLRACLEVRCKNSLSGFLWIWSRGERHRSQLFRGRPKKLCSVSGAVSSLGTT